MRRGGNCIAMMLPCKLSRKPAAGGHAVQKDMAVEYQGLVRFVAQLVAAIGRVCEDVPEARLRFAELLGPALERGRPT